MVVLQEGGVMAGVIQVGAGEVVAIVAVVEENAVAADQAVAEMAGGYVEADRAVAVLMAEGCVEAAFRVPELKVGECVAAVCQEAELMVEAVLAAERMVAVWQGAELMAEVDLVRAQSEVAEAAVTVVVAAH